VFEAEPRLDCIYCQNCFTTQGWTASRHSRRHLVGTASTGGSGRIFLQPYATCIILISARAHDRFRWRRKRKRYWNEKLGWQWWWWWWLCCRYSL